MTKNQPTSPELDSARQLLSDGKYRRACVAFAQLAENDNYRAAAHSGWAKALAGLQNYKEAVLHSEAAIEADPAESDAYDALQQIWDQIEDSDLLIARIQTKVDGTKAHAAHARWGKFLADRDRDADAIKEYKKAEEYQKAAARRKKDASRNQDASFYRWWGNAEAALGHHERAVELFRTAIPLSEPDDVDENSEVFVSLIPSLKLIGDPKGAIASIQTLFESLHRYDDIRLYWATVLYSLGEIDQGAAEYRKILSKRAGDFKVHNAWGMSLDGIGDNEAAVLQYETALRIKPDAEKVYQNLEVAIRGLNHRGPTIIRLDQVINETKNAAAHVQWGNVLAQIDQNEDALRHYQSALKIDPTIAATYISFAGAIEQSKRPDVIIDQIGQIVDHSNNPTAHFRFGCLLFDVGKPEPAIERFEKATGGAVEDADLSLRWGAALAAAGRHEDALPKYAEAVEGGLTDDQIVFKLDGDDVPTTHDIYELILDGLSKVKSESKKAVLEEIITQFQNSTQRDGDDWKLHLVWGKILVEQGKLIEGLKRYGIGIELGSGNMVSVNQLLPEFAKAARDLDDDARPVTELQAKIDALDGANAYYNWAMRLGELWRPGAELDYFRRAADKGLNDYDFNINYVARLIDADQSQPAFALLQSLADQKPDEDRAYYLWALALLRLRRYEEAADKCRRAVELGREAAHFEWGLALQGMRFYEAAIDKYKECLAKVDDPVTKVYAYHNIASVQEDQGDYRAASTAWARALEAYKDTFSKVDKDQLEDVFRYCASIYLGMKLDLDEATKLLAQSFDINPQNTDTLAAIAGLYLRRNEYVRLDEKKSEQVTQNYWNARSACAKAKKILTRQISELPSASTPIVNLGRLHLGMSEYAEAKKLFTQALTINSEDPDIYALLGTACLHTEEFKDAVKYLKTAVDRDPHNLDYCGRLAGAYQKCNMLDKAETGYNNVLAVAPGNVDALVGLGNTFTALGEDLQKNGKSSDADSMFLHAVDQYCLAATVAGDGNKRSRELSPVELATLRYSRGYAYVMRYEAQTFTMRDSNLLEKAKADFESIQEKDSNYYRAQRATLKIKERTDTSPFTPAQVGAWIILAGALLIFITGNVAFWVGKPGIERTFQITDRSVQVLKGLNVPEDVLKKLQSLTKMDAIPKAAFDLELKATAGEEPAKKYGEVIVTSAFAGPAFSWHDPLESGYYALLSFGALMFAVVGLYLQQISKLKFGGIELEKTSETITKASGGLGIARPDFPAATN